MFADDTSLFSTITNETVTAEVLNRDLGKVRLWAWQWKMQFNAEKTEEVIFSTKRLRPQHPSLKLGNDEIAIVPEHKHLGVILDSKLNFKSHIKEAVVKARRGIGIIRHISIFVSREVLDQVYKLYVRPHLDYGDIVYHKYDPEMKLDVTKKLEQTQYSAALAVTGTWRGTSRQRLYDELDWEDLYSRRRYRRLCHSYNLRQTRSPEYLFVEIRYTRAYDQSVGRTIGFTNTYFQNTLYEWNLLADDIKNARSLAAFKSKLLSTIRPLKRTMYGIRDIVGIRRLTKLRVDFSALNEHRFRHNFDCVSPLCLCGIGNEDNAHFLLHCHRFHEMRIDLLGQFSEVPGLDLTNMDSKALCELLLYGSPQLTIIDNRIILEAAITFINRSMRLD